MSSGTVHSSHPQVRVIEPKLLPPRVHPGEVKRARLLRRLDEQDRPVTLVDAGVGYGKTTMVRLDYPDRPDADA